MKKSKIKYGRIVLYAGMLLYITACELDSDQYADQLVEAEKTPNYDDETSTNLRLGNLIFEELFDGSNAFSRQSHQFAGSHSFQVANDPQNSGNKVGKFELRYTDKVVKSGKRAEVGLRASQREGWYSYSVFFPTSGFARDQHPEIISQWHQEGGGSPPNAIQIENDEIYLRSINRSDTKDNSNKVYTNYSLGKVERGKWHEFVFHIVHSPNSDGLIEIWHNKSKMHTIKGPNMRQGYPVPNLKVGIYKWVWLKQKTNTDRRVLYFDNVRIGNEKAGLTDFVSGIMQSGENAIGGIAGETNDGSQAGTGVEIITGFNLIQANTDRDLGPIANSEVISSPTHKLSIRANTSPTFKGEIHFKLTGANSQTYIDSSAPFALFGDDGKGDYSFGGGLYPGSYTLEATPYENGRAGKTAEIKFTIRGNAESEPEIITGFNLIQANIDRDLGPISSGETISTPTHKMSIRADVSSMFKGEIHFKLSGANSHTYIDSNPPFSLFGDNGKGDYFFGTGLPSGSYTLEATPHIDGKAGKPAVIKFTIRN